MRYILILFFTGLLTFSADAKPKVKETLKHYSISGNSALEFQSQMRKKGLKGFWGYTEWYVKWTGGCRVSVAVTITMPKLKNPSKAPKDVRQSFDKMYKALLKHERNHGRNGIRAATDIEKAKCKKTDPIFAKYNKADKDYDRKTKHGLTEGVRFK